MKFGIDKVLLLGCLGLWGGMLAESSLRTGDPRCFDGSCKPSAPKLQLPASFDTDPRSRSFEALQEANQSEANQSESNQSESKQSESNGPNPNDPDFRTSDPLGALNTQSDEDFFPRRLIQQDTRLPGGSSAKINRSHSVRSPVPRAGSSRNPRKSQTLRSKSDCTTEPKSPVASKSAGQNSTWY